MRRLIVDSRAWLRSSTPAAQTPSAADQADPRLAAAGFSPTRTFVQLAQLLPSPTLRPAELSSLSSTRLVVDEDSSHAILCPTPPSLRQPLAPGPLRAAPRVTP